MDLPPVGLSRRRALALGALATVSAALLSTCSDGSAPSRPPKNETGDQEFEPAGDPKKPIAVSDPQAETFIDAQLRFALALLTATVKHDGPNSNVVISPFSLVQVLAMIAQGANGTTYEQIAAAAGIGGGADVLAAGANATIGAVASLEKATVSSANALFRATGFDVKPAFDGVLVDNFGASPYPTDFASSAAAVGKINDWVASETNGKITDLLTADQVDADTRLVLVNACYLMAKWAHPFAVDETADGPLYTEDGAKSVPKLHKTMDVGYANAGGTEVVELSYEDDNLSAFIVAPPQGELDSMLTSGALGEVGALFDSAPGIEVRLQVPKFEARLRMDLSDVLKSMGITEAFTDSADFSNLSDEKTFLSFIQQEAWIKVTEKGTEAAAATAGGMEASAAAPGSESPLVDIDRPFLFVVRERTSNAVLFAAVVRDPSIAPK